MTLRFPARDRLDLGGEWSFEPVAHTEFREGGVLHDDTSDLPSGGTMPVPSNWHQHGLGGFHGRVAFRRDLPEVEGDGWWLCLAGVDYLAEVSVDGTLLARHEGAFDGFDVRIPAGSQQLEVVVDAPREELGTLWPYRKRQLKGIFTQWEPLEPFQETTGGIWGEVWLERRPETHVTQVTATTFLVPRPRIEDGAYVESGARDARVLVEVEVHAEDPATEELTVEVAGATASRVVEVAAGATRHRLAVTVADPALWWPWDVGDPVLHDLDVRLGADEAHDRIGLREVSFDATTGAFTVNGRDVRVRGSNVIPDKWLAGYGRVDEDIELILDAHLNAVRVCVHVTTDAFYDACDEAGVLVWQDLPLQWDYLITDAMVVEAADQAQRIVQRLSNHASIALWSCHNEPFPADAGNFVGPLVRAVRTVDGTRTVHPASDFAEHAYPGWFVGELRDYTRPPAAAIVTEFGAVGFPSAAELRAMGADWPPGGPAWDPVLHEPTPTLDVAGVDLGDSLEEAVLASQRYQARAVQTGVEAYRTQGRNYLHFLLMDGSPTVSWSVVSYGRVEKLGYAALARASQPVLIGAELAREVLSDAWDSRRFSPLAGGVWVVNDTDEALTGATWRALLGGHEVASGTLDVQPGAVSRWLPPGQRWPSWDPPDLPAGEHELELVLADAGGAERSRNAYRLTVLHRGLDLRPPHVRQQ